MEDFRGEGDLPPPGSSLDGSSLYQSNNRVSFCPSFVTMPICLLNDILLQLLKGQGVSQTLAEVLLLNVVNCITVGSWIQWGFGESMPP